MLVFLHGFACGFLHDMTCGTACFLHDTWNSLFFLHDTWNSLHVFRTVLHVHVVQPHGSAPPPLFFPCQAAVRRSDILENFAGRRGGAERAPR